MKRHGSFFTANIVLGIILAIIVIFDVMIAVGFNKAFDGVADELKYSFYDAYDYYDSYDTYDYYSGWYELVSMDKATAEPLGTAYNGNTAQEGYQYYKVDIIFSNGGSSSYKVDYLSITFRGEEYDDVWEMEGAALGETSALDYYNDEIIPAGQSTVVSQIIEVKDGVDQVELSFYNEDNEREEYTVELK